MLRSCACTGTRVMPLFLALCRDIVDLRDIHVQVAELVVDQGEDIDRIGMACQYCDALYYTRQCNHLHMAMALFIAFISTCLVVPLQNGFSFVI